ncbi:MAG: hypothetical protein NTV34_19240 [Proteobacteria bacterium]|nr:hypothetical protein [Pseudomonadota bacterium]
MFNFLNISLLCMITVLASACDGPRVVHKNKTPSTEEAPPKDTDLGTAPESSPPGPNPIPLEQVEIKSPAGLWKSNCVTASKNPEGVSGKTQKSQGLFSTDKVVFATELYLKGGCTSLTHSIVVTSSFAIRTGSRTDGPLEIDFVLERIELIPRTAEEAENMNDLEAYRMTNWKRDVALEITGKTRFPDEGPLPASGTVLYDVLSIEGNQIKFGLTAQPVDSHAEKPLDDGSTPGKRPRQVADDIIFIKQM